MQTTHVAAAIIARDDRVFAARRADAGQAGLWEFPGGKVEEGETPEQALRREVAEELGCDLTTMWYLDTVDHDYPDFHLTMDVYVCGIAEGAEPVLTVHEDGRWLDCLGLLDVEWLPADRGLIQAVGGMWDQLFRPEHL